MVPQGINHSLAMDRVRMVLKERCGCIEGTCGGLSDPYLATGKLRLKTKANDGVDLVHRRVNMGDVSQQSKVVEKW